MPGKLLTLEPLRIQRYFRYSTIPMSSMNHYGLTCHSKTYYFSPHVLLTLAVEILSVTNPNQGTKYKLPH